MRRFACNQSLPARIPRLRRCCGRWATPREQNPKANLATRWSKQKIGLQGATFATNSGKRMLNAGDLDGAISQFRNAVKLSPTYAQAHYQLAIALSRKGEKEEAAEEFKKAAELDPKLKPLP